MTAAQFGKTERVKRAIEWISLQRKMDPEKPVRKWIGEAIFRYDLSPRESDFLYTFYKDS